MPQTTTGRITIDNILAAAENLKGIAIRTPLMPNPHLSERYGANILLKREDLQVVRSYKIRGAYNKIQSLSEEQLKNGVACASAGNHAQGVALACSKKKIKGTIFMPSPTPSQKVNQVKMFGKEYVKVVLTGDTFDDAFHEALKFCEEGDVAFIPPFDDEKIIEGQATVGKEIIEDSHESIDYLILPIGGGGLAAGLASYFKVLSPSTKIIGVEPAGAPAMKVSIEKGEVVTLDNIDKFVDGAAVRRVGDITFEICNELLDEVITVSEGQVCGEILRLYNEQAIVVEPAGALAITALQSLRTDIKGKNVVCVVSGSNNDITRTMEIKERSLLYEGLKHYFIVNFPQRAGALREFLIDVLGPDHDITHFEYSKKNSREQGPALIGIELQNRDDLQPLMDRMATKRFKFEYVNDQPQLFHYLI
ncbi:Threonine dehydratase biosynthetic [Fulvivirga imtechensis AK7]|uniref:L-threonine dehydratase n=1 Tax=Fulvivirga imtechensis AK7 TaxID=1237149 RepID=L8JT34_9BACT|nr:threonine ammonia-lyase [Fulvivirga imtechensis]ELR72136.1 Threonine dehydratase biosynthetic [Fulvivirga imtechensis AK7]